MTIPKENRPKSPERKRKEIKLKKKTFYTLYKVSESQSSSKTNVRTTLGLGPMQNPPKISRGGGGCKEGGDVTRPGVTVDEENS